MCGRRSERKKTEGGRVGRVEVPEECNRAVSREGIPPQEEVLFSPLQDNLFKFLRIILFFFCISNVAGENREEYGLIVTFTALLLLSVQRTV